MTCLDACFFSHVGKVEKMCWAEVKHSHSNTTASISFRVNRIVQSILPNLLRLPPRCNPYCLWNSFILSPCRVETVLCWFKAFLTGCHYSLSHTLHHLHLYTYSLTHSASELSGFTCTSSPDNEREISIPHSAALCGIDNFEFIVSERVQVNPDNSRAMSGLTFLLFKLNTLQAKIVKVWVTRSDGVMTVVYQIYTMAITPR